MSTVAREAGIGIEHCVSGGIGAIRRVAGICGGLVLFDAGGVVVDCFLAACVALVILGPGALAPADPLVLERVEVRRVMNGWGLSEFAGVGVVRIAVDDCDLLGHRGLIVAGDEVFPAYVVDCSNAEHDSLTSRGIVADVSAAELGHREAIIMLAGNE